MTINRTEQVKIRMAWLRHAGKMARNGNMKAYTQALHILNDLPTYRERGTK